MWVCASPGIPYSFLTLFLFRRRMYSVSTSSGGGFCFWPNFFFFPLQFKPVHTQNKPSYLLPFFPWLELHSYSIWVKFLILTVLTLESPSPTFAPKRMFLCMVFFHPCRPTLLFCSCFLPLISVPTVWFLSKVRSYSIWIVSLNHKSVHVHH